MADRTSAPLHEVLGRLADAVGSGASSEGLAQRMSQMEEAFGPSTPTLFGGAPGTELMQAARWMDDADRAAVAFAEAERRLPALRAAAARHRKDSMGKWIALASVGAILLAILVGQLI